MLRELQRNGDPRWKIMVTLPQILGCFPTVGDWRDTYLDDGRQRLLGEAGDFSVEVILGDTLDHVGVFSHSMELPEMLAVMDTFLTHSETSGVIFARAREFFGRQPEGTFHHILGEHTLTLFHSGESFQFRISPSTDL